MKALFVPLYNDPYWRFARGSKTVEVRQLGPRWNRRTVYAGRPVVLSRGYSTPDRARGCIGRVARASSVPDLPHWAKAGADLRDVQEVLPYFDPDSQVIAFEVLDLAWPIPTDPITALHEGMRVGAAMEAVR